MTYQISRNGQLYGPYTEADVRQYIGTGHIQLTDLVQPEGSTEWALVGAVFAAYIAQTYITHHPEGPSATPPPGQGTAASPRLVTAQSPATQSPATQSPAAQPAPDRSAPAQPAMGQPTTAYTAPVAAVPVRLYPDPPDLPWWLALILGLITFGFFFVVWDIVQSAWLRRIERGSSALLLYIAVAVLYLIRLPGSWATVRYNFGGDAVVYSHGPGLASIALILILIARFVFRRELLAHFNGAEPLNLHLNWFWTLLFGGLYFQYKFNRINSRKRELQVSIPS